MESRITTLLPTIIFASIAFAQIGMARNGTLSPWKGGGYGMFAVQDSPGERFVTITAVTTDDETVHVRVSPGDLRDLGLRTDLLSSLQAYPDDEELNELLTGLSQASSAAHRVHPGDLLFSSGSRLRQCSSRDRLFMVCSSKRIARPGDLPHHFGFRPAVFPQAVVFTTRRMK
jgi:hypothetical protein